MEHNESFKMTYSARQQEEIQAIRRKYMAPEENKMEQLRALDAGAAKKAAAVSLIAGIAGTLMMGTGMSLTISDFGKPLGAAAMPLGIARRIAWHWDHGLRPSALSPGAEKGAGKNCAPDTSPDR